MVMRVRAAGRDHRHPMGALTALACGVVASIACRSTVTSVAQPVVVPAVAIGRGRTVEISGFAFVPKELTVALGDTVRWLNRDPFIHTTAADSGAWNSGNVPPGGIFVLVIARTGRFTYHCGAHPTMRAVLVVDSTRAPP